MTSAAILKDLKAGNFKPVYFLYGEEPYFIDKISRYIEENALQEHERSFNQMVLYGRDADMAGVLGNARRFPMMAERQVVIVKEAQDLADFKRDLGAKLLVQYLQDPQPSTILLFAYKHGKLDKRSAVWKALSKYAVVMESKKVYENQLPDIIQQMVAEKGRKISVQAVHSLTQLIGTNLDRLDGEINKTLINIKEGQEISNEVVLQYVGLSKDFNPFELIKALGKRDTQLVFRIVDFFEANPKNNPPVLTIIHLFRFFSQLMVYHRMADASPKEQAAKMGINPYFLNDFRVAVRNYPLSKVLQNIRYLHKADMQLKGMGVSGTDQSQIIKELVFKLLY